jgi:membrane protease YdiL (CAAX protease family)
VNKAPGRIAAIALVPTLLVGPLLAVTLATVAWPQRPAEALFVPIEALGVGLPALLLAGPGNLTARLGRSGWTACRPSAVVAATMGMLGLAILMTYGQMAWGELTGLSMPEGLADLMAIDGLGPKLAWLAVGAVILPGLCEETAFRGVLQRGLFRVHEAREGMPWARIAAVTAMFAAFHQDLYGLPSYLVLGAWLGLVAWRTSSLWPGVVAHMANNALALLQANLLDDPWWLAHVALLAPTGLVVAIAASWWLFRPANPIPIP